MVHTQKSNSGADHDRTIRRFALKITALLAIKYSLTLSTVWAFVWGTLTLVLRAAFSTPREALWWGLAGLFPVVVVALILARRRSPDLAAVRALLDRQSGYGGLLMAEEIADVGEWQQISPSITTPRVRWNGGRAWGLFLSAVAFLAITFLVPLRFAAMTADRPLAVAQETEELAEQIEALKQQEIIEADKAESLEQKLDEIRSDALGEDPAKTWEALDHLQDAIAKTAQEATEEMAANAAQLAQADALSKALMEASVLDSKLLTESMKELSDLTKAAAEDDRLLDSDLSQETVDGLKAGALSKEQLKRLSAALGKAKGRLAERLGELREAGLIDLKDLKKCENAGQCDSAGLAAFLAENGDDMSVAEMLALWGKTGKGGVSRGRGDAPMTWSDGTSEHGAKFKEQLLPPSALAGIKDSQLVGRSVGAPSAEKGGAAQSGALSGASSGSGSAFTQAVLPRHKRAVKRYFERPE